MQHLSHSGYSSPSKTQYAQQGHLSPGKSPKTQNKSLIGQINHWFEPRLTASEQIDGHLLMLEQEYSVYWAEHTKSEAISLFASEPVTLMNKDLAVIYCIWGLFTTAVGSKSHYDAEKRNAQFYVYLAEQPIIMTIFKEIFSEDLENKLLDYASACTQKGIDAWLDGNTDLTVQYTCLNYAIQGFGTLLESDRLAPDEIPNHLFVLNAIEGVSWEISVKEEAIALFGNIRLDINHQKNKELATIYCIYSELTRKYYADYKKSFDDESSEIKSGGDVFATAESLDTFFCEFFQSHSEYKKMLQEIFPNNTPEQKLLSAEKCSEYLELCVKSTPTNSCGDLTVKQWQTAVLAVQNCYIGINSEDR